MEQEKVQAGAAATPKGSLLLVYGGEEALAARALAAGRGKGAALRLRADDARQPMPEGGSRVDGPPWPAAMEAGEESVDYRESSHTPIALHRIPPTPHIAQHGRNLSSAFALFPRRLPARRPRIALPAAHHRLHRQPHPDFLTSTNRPSPSSLLAHPRYPRHTMGGNPQGRAQEEDQSHVALSKSPRSENNSN